jgi:hypothetical protein
MKTLFVLSTLTFVFVGCTTKGPALSPVQKNQITTKQIDATYNNTYSAVLNVLQYQHYKIRERDIEHGLIVANLDKIASKSRQFWQAFWWGYVPHQRTSIEITVHVSHMSDTLQELQMHLQKTKYNGYGGQTDVIHVHEAGPYDALFHAISVELKESKVLSRRGFGILGMSRGTRPQGERDGVRCFSVEPGEIGLTSLEGAGDGIDQHAKGRLAQLTAGLAQHLLIAMAPPTLLIHDH